MKNANETLLNDKHLVYNAGAETVKEYMSGDSVKKFTPTVKLLTAPFASPFIPIELVSQDLGGIIQSCQLVKSRCQAGGSVNIVIAGDNDAIQKLGLSVFKPLQSLWSTMGPDLRDIFKPMSYCQLWLDGYHVLSGYVRECRRQISAGNDITYNIVIDELGNIYQQNIISNNTNIHCNPTEQYNEFLKELYSKSASQAGLPLWYSLMKLLDVFSMTTLNFGSPTIKTLMSDGIPLSMRLVALPPPLGGISLSSIVSRIATSATFFSNGGSYWDFIKSLCPDPFMELFTESGGRTICINRVSNENSEAFKGVGDMANKYSWAQATMNIKNSANLSGISVLLPGFSYVIARSSPYDIPWLGGAYSYKKLYSFSLGVMELIAAGDFIIVTDDDVISKDLGISDRDQYTLFSVGFTGDVKDQYWAPSISRGPVNPFFSGGIKTYGARELATSLPFCNLRSGKISDVTAMERMYKNKTLVSDLSTLLNIWFRNSGKFTEGSITTRSIPFARPGMCLLYLPSLSGSRVDCNRDIGIYYIDNISCDYAIGEKATTTMSLIRGTPLPLSSDNLMRYFFDWEMISPDRNKMPWEEWVVPI